MRVFSAHLSQLQRPPQGRRYTLKPQRLHNRSEEYFLVVNYDLNGYIQGHLYRILVWRGRSQGQESRDITEGELNWLDDLLSDGRKHLVGEKFSRVDIAAASLLARLALPPQHRAFGNIRHPQKMARDLANRDQRPSMFWVRKNYEQY